MTELRDLSALDVLRIVTTVLLFVTFLIMTYKGVRYWIEFENSFKWSRFVNLWWTFLGGFMVGNDLRTVYGYILLFVVAVLQMWVALFRFELVPSAKQREFRIGSRHRHHHEL